MNEIFLSVVSSETLGGQIKRATSDVSSKLPIEIASIVGSECHASWRFEPFVRAKEDALLLCQQLSVI